MIYKCLNVITGDPLIVPWLCRAHLVTTNTMMTDRVLQEYGEMENTHSERKLEGLCGLWCNDWLLPRC